VRGTSQFVTEADWNQIPLKELIGKISQGWSPKCDLTRDALPDEWAIMTTTAVQSMRYIDNQGKPLPSTFTPRPNIEIKVGDFLMTRNKRATHLAIESRVHRSVATKPVASGRSFY